MSNRLLVSTRKGLFVLERTSDTWKPARSAFLGDNVTLSFLDPRDGGLYAALNLGHFGVKLKFSPDMGITWEDREVPKYLEGETIASGDGKPPRPASLQLIWALESDGSANAGGLWAGTAPGGLFHSPDGGKTWKRNEELWNRPERAGWMGGGYDWPAIHSICVDPRDPGIIRVAVSTGGALVTFDGGKTWESTKGMVAEYMPPGLQDNPDAQDAHRMVQCPASPDRLWIQHHNGIFRSDDGKTWNRVVNVSPSEFGFAVAVHPRDPDTAWFVPAVKDERRYPADAKLVVNRTRDGGKTFETLNKGLPDSAYDLVYRHCLAIDGTGNKLAFGSTTGGMWSSDDGGDSWSLLPTRLPPVHAVAFA